MVSLVARKMWSGNNTILDLACARVGGVEPFNLEASLGARPSHAEGARVWFRDYLEAHSFWSEQTKSNKGASEAGDHSCVLHL